MTRSVRGVGCEKGCGTELQLFFFLTTPGLPKRRKEKAKEHENNRDKKKQNGKERKGKAGVRTWLL